jgi:hypothetical protein
MRHWLFRKVSRDESGQIIPLAAALGFVCVLFVGFAVDPAGWFSDTSRLQEGADASAMSGAIYYLEQDINQPPAPTSPCSGQANAVACATMVAGLNNLPSGSNLTVTSSATGGFDGGPSVTVSVVNPNPPNIIAKLIGITPSTHATASASIVGPGQESGDVVPMGINIDAAKNWAGGSQQALDFDKSYANGDGNFFTLLKNNFGCNGAKGLKDCISSGCGSCTATLGDTLNKDDGNNWDPGGGTTCSKSGGERACSGWFENIGKTFLIPVYSNEPPNPDTILGFVSVTAQTCSGANAGDAGDSNYICFTFNNLVTSVSAGPPGGFFGIGNAALTA